MKQTWTQPVCDDCWYFAQWLKREEQKYEPVRVREPEIEQCCNCAGPAIGGIYVRVDPRICRFPREVPDE